MSLVLDASMTITWLFDDERTEAAHEIMRRVVAEGALVPTLWRLEVANVLRNAHPARALRRGVCGPLPGPAWTPRDHERRGDRCHAWGATRRLSREENLTLYDAAYLELAMRLKIPLASCDAALLAAASPRKIPLLTA